MVKQVVPADGDSSLMKSTCQWLKGVAPLWSCSMARQFPMFGLKHNLQFQTMRFFKGCCKRNTDAAGLVSVGGSSLKT